MVVSVDSLETYLRALYDARLGGGVAETSGYAALANLLNEVGGGLKPKVRCFMNLKNRGAGLPDGGLFTADQLRARPLESCGAARSRRAAPSRSSPPATSVAIVG